MPKYRTRDQYVKYGGEYIPPYTEVNVPTGDTSIWDRLVAMKVAMKVSVKRKAAPEVKPSPAEES